MDECSDSGSEEIESFPKSEQHFAPAHVLDSSSRDGSAWFNLKTITTFDSAVSTTDNMGVENHTHNHASHIKSFSKIEKATLKGTASEQQSHHQTISYNVDASELQDPGLPYGQPSERRDKSSVPQVIKGECSKNVSKHKRERRRSRNNSLSEGHNPYGMEPASHFSVSSSPPRNGVMSDVGIDRTNHSMKSNTPGPMQSLTRFSPKSLLVESLIDQLCKLMEKDTEKQKRLYHVICERLHQMQLIDDTYTIEEFQFMRSHYQKALYQLLAVAKSSTQSCSTRNILLPLPSTSMNVDIEVYSEQVTEWSRYQHEYQELEYIAKGGFGHVYKVRNKLDGGEYAIKKIFLRYRYVEGFLRSLKEVKMLARLNHPNIVSYKAAWLEPLDDEKYKAQANKSSGSSTSLEASFPTYSKSNLPLPPPPEREDSLDIVFQESSPDNQINTTSSPKPNHSPEGHNMTETESQTQPISNHMSNSTDSSSSTDDAESSKSSDEVAICPMNAKESKRSSTSSSTSRNWATLYVQMQLCQRTLRQWLDERNYSFPAYPLAPQSQEGMLALTLFRKIVRGVDYIHMQGIVHHDIKPSNIFVNGNLKEVQVGDFGLSCCILSRVDSTGVLGEHHGEVGTRMYAAPEQLRGKCTSKSDLYSLGIVLLELLQPFHTDMERTKVIQKLRAGFQPPELVKTWPHAARLINDLLVNSPASRPTASDLLKRVESLIRSNTENNVSSQLASKDETIKLLQEAVASRDQEIAELRRRLSIFENN